MPQVSDPVAGHTNVSCQALEGFRVYAKDSLRTLILATPNGLIDGEALIMYPSITGSLHLLVWPDVQALTDKQTESEMHKRRMGFEWCRT